MTTFRCNDRRQSFPKPRLSKHRRKTCRPMFHFMMCRPVYKSSWLVCFFPIVHGYIQPLCMRVPCIVWRC